jgi:uncharacterized caspase-like protein
MLARLTMVAGVFLAFFLAALLPSSASAERRVALVIGNAAYKHATMLRNPGNDANDVAETLKKLGFDVLLGLDLDQQGFARTIEQFARTLDDADVGLFFYAGHGLQMNEKNYLVSTNAKLENEFLLSSETIELDAIVRLMESKVPTNLVFLDACRNNPLAENLRRSLASLKRGAQLGRGLARMEAHGRDTLIAFAAAPGQEANDGSERNSPFTSALLRHIPKPGLEVSVMLKEVAADVRRDTRNGQRPQQLSDMTKTFYFAKLEQPATTRSDAPAPAAATSDDRALDVAYWSSAQAANDCGAVRAYLQRFPQGAFVELARIAERRLCVADRKTAAIDPGTPQAADPAAAAPARVPQPASGDLARGIKLELVRLGCATGDADDSWNNQARDALRKFNRYAKARLALDQPTSEVVAALRGHDKRVCPLECRPGTRARGDVCVAIDRVEPARSRNVERPQERKRPAAARAAVERPAAAQRPAAAAKPAAASKADFASPLCESRTQTASGKWCCTYDPPRGASVIICR